MIKRCKVSVIIPVYNVEEYLRETLDSVVNQTLDNFELIIVNDGSTDGSQAIIDEYEKKYDIIKKIYQKNRGPGAARNSGIDMAVGEYIIFVDSDDIIPKDSLRQRYIQAKESDSDLSICATCMYDGENKWPIKSHFLEGYKSIRKNHELLWIMGPCNKIYKRDLIKNNRFPEDINYGEDQVFVLRAYLEANKIFTSKYVGYYYRIRKRDGGSLTQQVFVDPSKVIQNITELWKYVSYDTKKAVDNKNEYNSLMNAYFYRLVNVNIWPPLKEAFIGSKKDDKQKVFSSLKNLVKVVDIKHIENLGKIKKVVFKILYKDNDGKFMIDAITALVYTSNKLAMARKKISKLIKKFK